MVSYINDVTVISVMSLALGFLLSLFLSLSSVYLCCVLAYLSNCIQYFNSYTACIAVLSLIPLV